MGALLLQGKRCIEKRLLHYIKEAVNPPLHFEPCRYMACPTMFTLARTQKRGRKGEDFK